MEKTSEPSGNGNGVFYLERILGAEQMGEKCSLYAKVTIPPNASVGYHEHHGNAESYFILSGEGVYDDNGVKRTVKAGDSTWTADGSGHSLENTGKTDLVFMALIINS